MDVYIQIVGWVVIVILIIIHLTKLEIRFAEDRINKLFDYFEEETEKKREVSDGKVH